METEEGTDVDGTNNTHSDKNGSITNVRILQGPKGYPVIGNLLTFSTLNLHKQAQEWQREFGPIFECTVLYKKFIFVSNLRLIRLTSYNEENCRRLATFFGQYVLPYSIAMTQDFDLSMKLKGWMSELLRKQTELEGEHPYILKPIKLHFERVASLETTVVVTSILKEVLQDCLSKQTRKKLVKENEDGNCFFTAVAACIEDYTFGDLTEFRQSVCDSNAPEK